MGTFSRNESSEDSFTFTSTRLTHLDTSNTIAFGVTTTLTTFIAQQYSGINVYALDAKNAQLFLNGQAFQGYLLQNGLNHVTLPAGQYWFGSVYTGSISGSQTVSGFVEAASVDLPGSSFIGNVPFAVDGNAGAWKSRGFTITGTPSLYIETEGTGGKFMIMNESQYQSFASAHPNGFFGGSYSYTYALGGLNGGPSTEIEGELKLNPGSWYLVWINDTSSWQGGAADISGFASSNGDMLNVPPTDTTPPLLIATSPSLNSLNVGIDSNIVLTFNESVYSGSGSINIYKADGSLFRTISVTDSSQLSFSGANIIVNPSVSLSASSTYYLTISQSAIHDASGNNFLGVSSSNVIRFSTSFSISTALVDSFKNILRISAPVGPTFDFEISLSNQINSGTMSTSQAIGQVVNYARSTTSVATLAYEFFTGSTPTTAGMDYLVSPTGPNPNNLNSAYYQSFSLENRYINFAVNLGKAGAGQATFQAGYGSLSLSDSLSKAYATIFGSTPSAGKIDLLLNGLVPNGLGGTETRAQYFAFYGQDGLNGLGTKAAMVGWLLGEAVKADIGDYALSNDAFLTAIANGTTTYGVDLIGQFDKPSYHYISG